MLVLLPPSEGKAAGGDGPPLDLASLSYPALTPVRERLVGTLVDLARTQRPALQSALGLTERQTAALDEDAALTTSPTMRAIERYTGVIYDNLGYSALAASARRRADRSLVVASALFGLLRTRDLVPAHRLSGSTVLPGLGGLAPVWRPALEPVLADVRGPVVDLRSGPYAALARVPGAIAVHVLRDVDGRRTVVSHDNKWTKGRFARVLCEHGARSARDVVELARTCADDVEVDGRRISLVLHGLASARM